MVEVTRVIEMEGLSGWESSFGLGHLWTFLNGFGLGLCIMVGVLACIFCLESLYESSLGLQFWIVLLRFC